MPRPGSRIRHGGRNFPPAARATLPQPRGPHSPVSLSVVGVRTMRGFAGIAPEALRPRPARRARYTGARTCPGHPCPCPGRPRPCSGMAKMAMSRQGRGSAARGRIFFLPRGPHSPTSLSVVGVRTMRGFAGIAPATLRPGPAHRARYTSARRAPGIPARARAWPRWPWHDGGAAPRRGAALSCLPFGEQADAAHFILYPSTFILHHLPCSTQARVSPV
jgi:hypothetical protein